MAYIECPSCGKSALRVASRCPHCGLIFTPGMIPPPEPNRFRLYWAIAGALVLFAVIMLARNRPPPRAVPPRATPVATAPTPTPPAAPAPTASVPAATVPAESVPETPVAVVVPSGPVQQTAPARDSEVDSTPSSAAAPPQAAPQAQAAPQRPQAEAQPQAETQPQAEPPPSAPTGDLLQRYATTWVNVRGRRSPSAPPVRVLDPGEAILVDSLIGGWYRVVIDGQPIGYAYGSNLSEQAPSNGGT